MATSKNSNTTSGNPITAKCALCLTTLNITEYESPYCCSDLVHPSICYRCYTLLSEKVCTKCGADLKCNSLTRNSIFSELRKCYFCSSYEKCSQTDRKLRSDMNLRMKPLKQLILMAKKYPLSESISYNTYLRTKMTESEKMYEGMLTVREKLNKNEVTSACTDYKSLCGENCDNYILACEYLKVIYKVGQSQYYLFQLFTETEKLKDVNGKKTVASCKEFILSLECDLAKISLHNQTQVKIRIGLIGNSKQGKSSLCNYLRDLIGAPNETNQDLFANIGALDITTLCVVPYSHNIVDEQSKTQYSMTFMDVPGFHDMADEATKHAIYEADCDAYLLVQREGPFSKLHYACKKYIEVDLKRQCLFVQSGADATFNLKFKDLFGHAFNSNEPDAEQQFNETIEEMKSGSLSVLINDNINGIATGDVYLVACPAEAPEEMNDKRNFYKRFDLDILQLKLIEIGKIQNKERMKRDTIKAAKYFVDINFQRNYKIWNWGRLLKTVGVSFVPFLDIWYTKHSVRQIQDDLGLNEDYIEFLKKLKDKYNTDLDERPMGPTTSKLGSAISATKGAAAAGTTAIKLSTAARAAAVIGGVSLGPLMLAALAGTTVAQAIATPFQTRSQLENYLSNICNHMNEVVEQLVNASLG